MVISGGPRMNSEDRTKKIFDRLNMEYKRKKTKMTAQFFVVILSSAYYVEPLASERENHGIIFSATNATFL